MNKEFKIEILINKSLKELQAADLLIQLLKVKELKSIIKKLRYGFYPPEFFYFDSNVCNF